MTSAQLEPSAHAPCTSTTLRASTGAVVWALACRPPNVPARRQTAIAAPTFRTFIDLTPSFDNLPGALLSCELLGRFERRLIVGVAVLAAAKEGDAIER